MQSAKCIGQVNTETSFATYLTEEVLRRRRLRINKSLAFWSDVGLAGSKGVGEDRSDDGEEREGDELHLASEKRVGDGIKLKQ